MSNLSDQIKALITSKAALLIKMEEMSSRSLDDGEQKTFDDLKTEINDLTSRQTNLEETEQLIAANKSVNVQTSTTPIVTTPSVEKQDKTLFFPKMLHCMHVAKNDSGMASAYAKSRFGDELLSKALTMPAEVIQKASVAAGNTGTDTWAEELTTIGQYNSAFIEMLRAQSIVARFPGRQMTFDGNNSILIPRQTAGSTGGWVAQAGGIKVNKLALDQVTLAPVKNGVIIPVTNELLARSDPSALGLVRDDILKGIATTIDTKFVSSDAASAGVSPAGIQTFDSSSTASAGDTLDNVTTDLKLMITAMTALNMPMQQPVWIMHPTRVNSLRFIRDGLGQYAFRDEINSGMLAGYPIIESTTCTATVVMLVDASQIIIATDLAPEIAISTDASLHMVDGSVASDIGGSTTPVTNMFQTDSTAIRGVTRLDWAARYTGCVQVLTSATW